jgi:glycosyltransferase EpsF
VTVIPNAIDIDRFAAASGAQVRSDLRLPADCLTILQVGRYMPVKNHAFSVRMAIALKEAGVDFRMLFVGAGPGQAAIETLVQTHGLQEQVLLLGLRADIPELMAAADVMLLPSLHEGFPVVLVESQAAGLPAVVSSAISPEVDLGLGLVDAVDLGAPLDRWVQGVCRIARPDVPGQHVRRATLSDRGFSSVSGARLLEQVYDAA